MSRNIFFTAVMGVLIAGAPAYAAPGQSASKGSAKAERAEGKQEKVESRKEAKNDKENKDEESNSKGCNSFSSSLLKKACDQDKPTPPGHCNSRGNGHEIGKGKGHDKDDDCAVSS